jgi:hypothetical protein
MATNACIQNVEFIGTLYLNRNGLVLNECLQAGKIVYILPIFIDSLGGNHYMLSLHNYNVIKIL